MWWCNCIWNANALKIDEPTTDKGIANKQYVDKNIPQLILLEGDIPKGEKIFSFNYTLPEGKRFVSFYATVSCLERGAFTKVVSANSGDVYNFSIVIDSQLGNIGLYNMGDDIIDGTGRYQITLIVK